jgi:hypothetical protein
MKCCSVVSIIETGLNHSIKKKTCVDFCVQECRNLFSHRSTVEKNLFRSVFYVLTPKIHALSLVRTNLRLPLFVVLDSFSTIWGQKPLLLSGVGLV